MADDRERLGSEGGTTIVAVRIALALEFGR